MIMNKFYCLLTGDRAREVEAFGAASRKKVTLMALGLIVVTIYWFVVGYILGRTVLEMSAINASVMAAFCAFIVLCIDRSFILMPDLNGWVASFRVIMALLVAILGGTGLDLILYHKEVQQELIVMQSERTALLEQGVHSRYAQRLEAANERVREARAAFERSELELKEEMKGAPTGTGLRGLGPVAKQLKELRAKRHHELEESEAGEALVRHALERETRLLVETNDQLAQTPALFERVEALHRYAWNNKQALWAWGMITLLLILVELLPIIAKLGWRKETAYEIGQRVADELHIRHIQQLASIDIHEARALRTLQNAQDSQQRMRRIS